MTEQKIDTWAVTVNVNNEDVLTIGHSHVSGIADFDDVAPIIRTCAAHLLSFIGEGPDHVGNHIALSRAILQAATRNSPSADAVDAKEAQEMIHGLDGSQYGLQFGDGGIRKGRSLRPKEMAIIRKGLKLLAASAQKGDGND